jgi:aspartyl/asparaginyl-tRNA synthetase
MERTLIKDLRSAIGQTVQLKGWLQTLRDQKKIQFLILRDPTGLAQVAHWKPNDESENWVLKAP